MKLDTFSFDEPTRIICGIGSCGTLPNEITRLGCSSIMIVCDRGVVEAGLIYGLEQTIKDMANIRFCIFDKVISNPYDTTMDSGYQMAKENGVDLIIGIGGGSSLDTAKGIALLLTNGGKMREYLMEGREAKIKIAPTICIPTTAGTGSEVTRTIVATDSTTKFKDGFKFPDTLYADTAILDSALLKTLPSAVLAACGMDALTHAIEGYITWKGNPITDALNLQAIQMIGENIRKAYAQPSNLEAKENLLLASTMTGIAFDQSGLGLAHCMGHPMGGLFNIPHGVACAMALPITMEFNVLAVPEKLGKVAIALGEDVSSLSQMEAAQRAVAAVRNLMEDLDLPTSLTEINISEHDIKALTEDAMKFPGMRGANPRAASYMDVETLFKKLL